MVVVLLCLLLVAVPALAQTARPTPAEKTQAIQDIQHYGPIMKTELTRRFKEIQKERMRWYAITQVALLPAVGFFGFLLFPVLLRKSIRSRLGHYSAPRLFRLYLVQAFLAYLMLTAIGLCLLIPQAVYSGLSRESNPQLVMQEDAIDYVVKNGERLVDRYPRVYITLGQEMTRTPDESIISLILEGGLERRNDPLLSAEAGLVNFTWPTIGAFFFVSFGLTLLLFLQRLWPDIVSMLRYPLEIMEGGDRTGQPGMGEKVRKLIRTELRGALTFLAVSFLVVFVTGFFLGQFCSGVVARLIEISSAGVIYLLNNNGSALLVALSVLLVLLFMLESVIVFLLVLTFYLGKVSEAARAYASGKIDKPRRRHLRRVHFLRFIWVLGLITALGIGLSYVLSLILNSLVTGPEADWVLVLVVPPLLLLVGLNLGMWLLRGFSTLKLLYTAPVVEIPAGEVSLAPLTTH